jgi:hypothetical protein
MSNDEFFSTFFGNLQISPRQEQPQVQPQHPPSENTPTPNIHHTFSLNTTPNEHIYEYSNNNDDNDNNNNTNYHSSTNNNNINSPIYQTNQYQFTPSPLPHHPNFNASTTSSATTTPNISNLSVLTPQQPQQPQQSQHPQHQQQPQQPSLQFQSSLDDFIFIESNEEGYGNDSDDDGDNDMLFSPTPTTRSRAPYQSSTLVKPPVPSRNKPTTTTTTTATTAPNPQTMTIPQRPNKHNQKQHDMSLDSFADSDSLDPIIMSNPTSPPSYSSTSSSSSISQHDSHPQSSTTAATPTSPTNPTERTLPCLYTIKPRGPVGEHQVMTAYVDINECHTEQCHLANKLARHGGDECTCGGISLSEKLDDKSHRDGPIPQFATIPNPDHDFDAFLEPPNGSISSQQCTQEEKNTFLRTCLFSQPPIQINEPSYIKAYAITFNHYETIPTAKSILQMLPQNPLEFNVYAFSFQECGQMLKNQAVPNQVTTPILNALNNLAKGTVYSYKLIACERIMSLFTFVIARIDLAPYIHHVSTMSVTTGLLDLVGNKGAAIIRFFIKRTSFAIVGCHFNAGQNDLYRRNGDYHRINSKCNLGMHDTTAIRDQALSKPITPQQSTTLLECSHPTINPNSETSPLTTHERTILWQQILNSIKIRYKYNYVFASPRLTAIATQRLSAMLKYRPSNTMEGKGVYTFTGSTKKEDSFTTPEQLYEFKNDIATRHDVVIWLGDLNYRIGTTTPTIQREKVLELLQQGQQTTLISPRYEQLMHEKDVVGTIFHGFKEGKIAFPPSYKYDVGTQNFDSSQKSRIPSWTDRILFIDNCSQCFHQLYDACDCNGFTKTGPVEGNQCLFETTLGKPTSLKRIKRTNCSPCQKVLLERYGSIQTVVTSDHKPVFAYFYINVAEKVNPGE